VAGGQRHEHQLERQQFFTPAEIDGMRTHGIGVESAFTGDRFVHCIARPSRRNIERIIIAIGLLGDMDEQHYRQALHDADFILGGQVERLAQ
jgi:hypothetical protein